MKDPANGFPEDKQEPTIGSEDRNAMDEAAKVAAVSPATSEAGFGASTMYTVRAVSMSSGLSQQLWNKECGLISNFQHEPPSVSLGSFCIDDMYRYGMNCFAVAFNDMYKVWILLLLFWRNKANLQLAKVLNRLTVWHGFYGIGPLQWASILIVDSCMDEKKRYMYMVMWDMVYYSPLDRDTFSQSGGSLFRP
ncbi:hypothetical protein L6452_13097 [Arctium lappa]|uniref:Uncharacterized protein n=1 Tax=Arctium lappa TaxID=4217 RepID=A0ACB9CHB6_ARCLA|nr:hypothetical protein L6452_13097 [Arctium lappa]